MPPKTVNMTCQRRKKPITWLLIASLLNLLLIAAPGASAMANNHLLGGLPTANTESMEMDAQGCHEAIPEAMSMDSSDCPYCEEGSTCEDRCDYCGQLGMAFPDAAAETLTGEHSFNPAAPLYLGRTTVPPPPPPPIYLNA